MTDQLSNDLASLRISRETNPEGGGAAKYVVIALVGVVVAGVGYFVALPYLESKVFKQEVSATEVALVSPAQSSVQLTASGYIVPQKSSKVSARVTGRIVELLAVEGDEVKAGQVLVKIDDSNQRSAILAAQARVFAAQARSEASRAAVGEIKLQAERQRAMADKGVAPKATAEDLEARLRSLSENVRAAEAETRSAQAEVKSLDVILQQMTVTAPISGKVVSKFNQVGELVGPEVQPSVIMEIADFSSLMVEVDVPEVRLHMVKIGGPGEIVLDAFPGKRYRGAVKEIIPRVNRAKAAVTVKVEFVDMPETVLPEMSARVSFLEKALEADAMKEPPKLIVPSSAVVKRNGNDVVFILDDDKVRMTQVKLGSPFGSGHELAEGPRAGTKLVNNPSATLEDGQSVKEKLK